MLLNFIKAEFREDLLVEKYFELISCGVEPVEILVLAQNSTSKQKFIDRILKNLSLKSFEKLNIHSFF